MDDDDFGQVKYADDVERYEPTAEDYLAAFAENQCCVKGTCGDVPEFMQFLNKDRLGEDTVLAFYLSEPELRIKLLTSLAENTRFWVQSKSRGYVTPSMEYITDNVKRIEWLLSKMEGDTVPYDRVMVMSVLGDAKALTRP